MTSPSRAIWWYEDSSGTYWIIGRETKKGTSSGWLYNNVSSLPYVGNDNDWSVIADTDTLFTLQTQTGEINVKCTGKSILLRIFITYITSICT